MTIKSIMITPDEMKEAVQQYLHFKGISVQVTNVDSVGYPLREWEITSKPQEDFAPVISSVEELGKAIEEGKV